MKTTLCVLALVTSVVLNLILTGPHIATAWRQLRQPLLATAPSRPSFRGEWNNRSRLGAETNFRRAGNGSLSGAVTLDQTGVAPRQPQTIQVTIELIDGSRVIGVPEPGALTLQTEMGKLDVPLVKVVSIKLKGDRESVLVELRNQDKITGFIEGSSLPVTTLLGKVALPLQNVRELRFTPK